MRFEKANVLITGGASGIGKIMGRMALEKGAGCLIIWDINPAGIETAKTGLGKYGKVKGYVVDVSRNELIMETYNKVVSECGPVDILINCAGIVTSNKTFDKLSADEIIRTISINTTAPMLVARAMLPDMIRNGRGHICNITSAAGMLGNPNMSAYGASKWGAIGWSESLYIEMKKMKTNIGVTTIAPYYISTGMFDGVKSRIIPILKPEYAAGKIIKAIEKNTRFKGLPFGWHFIRFCQAILPMSWFDTIVGEWLGIYHTMDDFTGRKTVTGQ